jgi:hypothetical protein
MGYTTEFKGRFQLDKPLKTEHLEYLQVFSFRRHMTYDVNVIANIPDPFREAAGLPLGEFGEYFVGDIPSEIDNAVLDYNHAPRGVPGLWCQWVPNQTGEWLEWDEVEKFYYYVEWLGFLIVHFLEPWGYTLNGQVSWRGDDPLDIGLLIVEDNRVNPIYIEPISIIRRSP